MTVSPVQIVVFVGPSLAVGDARAVLDADYRPPVRRGDIEALGQDPRIIGIIDGRFFESFAISPKELLLPLEAGVKVLGSSSMGALRAVELAPFGMIGVGQIYEMFRSGCIDADDEVAMTFREETWQAQSVPMVNIRVALAAAANEGIISRTSEQRLITAMKAIYFPDRSYARLLAVGRELLPQGEHVALTEYLNTRAPDAKRTDALQLLHEIRMLAAAI